MNHSLSIVIPCYNEQENIGHTINAVIQAVQTLKIKYEIIIVDDASNDSSREVIKKLVNNNQHITFLFNKLNIGLSKTLIKGLTLAKYEYLTWVPGDNNHPKDGLKKTYKEILKNYDLIIPYHINLNDRKFVRFILSKIYTFIVNILTSKKLKYYNGLSVYKKKYFNKSKFISYSSFNMSFLAASLVYISNRTSNYIEIPVKISEDKKSKSTSLNFKNIKKTLYFFYSLIVNGKIF